MKRISSLWGPLLGSAMLTAVLCEPATARCTDEVAAEAVGKAARSGKPLAPVAAAEAPLNPHTQLQLVAREASRRSAEFGAARLMAEAAHFDLDETRAGRYPTVSVNGTLGAGASDIEGTNVSRGAQGNVSLNMSARLYDGGKLEQLSQWRSQMADVAKFGATVTQEQVVLEAVTTALERNRYRLQAQVYAQYVRKMSCLVEALEQIVAEDKGRTSELVQARKTQSQAELSRDAAQAQSRQIELKLRKLVGDSLIPGDAITVPLASVPELGEVKRLIERSGDVQQLLAQAGAMDSYAKAITAGQKPQVNWALSKTEGVRGKSSTSSWQAGITVSYTMFNGGADKAAALAASKRAEAARQQYAELLATRFYRTAEVYDVAITSIERAKRYVDVLRDSERVRNFTFQQWSQLGRRSLFDVMSSESDHFQLRIAYVNALHDGYSASAQLHSMGQGLAVWLVPELKAQN